ncbi:connectin-like [Pollicipes pollicipes]|uniref:connectin-like n=1 Tax=Pollicipes pollicipes TaxID=41117 RepID=UPI00188597AA|nr:connectin-like [Pollicipes pollicipes]
MQGSLVCCGFLLSLASALIGVAAAEDARALSPQDLDALENVCDLKTLSNTMYCYCDFLQQNQAEIGNCWIYDDTHRNDTLWDTFHHQVNLRRLTINLRGDGSLTYVPRRVLSYTKQLWLLELKNAAIRRLRGDAFASSSSLAELVLTSNAIEHLGKHAFSNLSNLTRLNLGKNKLKELGRHVFKNLPKLKQLYLDRNSLSKIRNNAFGGLGRLKELELFDNSLEQVSHGTFKGLRELERLDLHRNLLESIEDDTFATLSKLKDLDLQENRIKYISEKGLVGLRNLMRLNLYDNKLLNILPGTFQDATGVFYLDIQQNVLDTMEETSFSPILDNMKNITMYLFVQDNNLHCDCRLAWLLRLRVQTASAHVQAALDSTVCYMDGGTVPPRLEAPPTPDPALETSTLGIGPPVRLMDLKVHELPCDRPLAEEPALEHRGLELEPDPEPEPHPKPEPEERRRGSENSAARPAPVDTTPPAGSAVVRDSVTASRGSGASSAAPGRRWLLAVAASPDARCGVCGVRLTLPARRRN